jgi:hypothetical protein
LWAEVESKALGLPIILQQRKRHGSETMAVLMYRGKVGVHRMEVLRMSEEFSMRDT